MKPILLPSLMLAAASAVSPSDFHAFEVTCSPSFETDEVDVLSQPSMFEDFNFVSSIRSGAQCNFEKEATFEIALDNRRPVIRTVEHTEVCMTPEERPVDCASGNATAHHLSLREPLQFDVFMCTTINKCRETRCVRLERDPETNVYSTEQTPLAVVADSPHAHMCRTGDSLLAISPDFGEMERRLYAHRCSGIRELAVLREAPTCSATGGVVQKWYSLTDDSMYLERNEPETPEQVTDSAHIAAISTFAITTALSMTLF